MRFSKFDNFAISLHRALHLNEINIVYKWSRQSNPLKALTLCIPHGLMLTLFVHTFTITCTNVICQSHLVIVKESLNCCGKNIHDQQKTLMEVCFSSFYYAIVKCYFL